MRKFIQMCFIASASFIMLSCNSGDEADETNDTTAANNDTMGDNDRNRERDVSFLNDAYYHSLEEIEKGKLAKTRAQSKDVKDLADMIVKDHTDMSNKIKSLVTSKGYTLEKDALTTDDRDKINNNDKKGRDFDREYADEMVDDHEKDINKFEEVANDNNNRDPEVKALASEALPKLRQHLEKAKAVKEKVKG